MRLSQIQKDALIILTKCVYANIHEVRAADLRPMVGEDIHRNNWRVSMMNLEKHGLLMRNKPDLEWYINLTPEGFEKGVELIKAGNKKGA